MTQSPLHVAIIGAGINGVATAIWLQRKGHQVTILDPRGPAGGTSYGNGGVLASCSVVPVTAPGLLAKAPRMLLDPNQPLFLRWSYLPRLLPWLFPYLRHANAADARRIAQGLTPIVGDSLEQHRQLAEGTGAEGYIVPCDYNFLYRDRAHYQGDAFGFGLRREMGLRWRELEGREWRDYEPAFGPEIGFAASFGDHGRIKDPGGYVSALASHVERLGGRLLRSEATAILSEDGQVTGVRAGGDTIAADRVVLTAGVWSGTLGRQLGLNVPLESERGYHVELWDPSITPRSANMVASGKFVITPMEGRLRLAGIVEFGGLDAPASDAPLRLLERQVRAAMPDLKWSRKDEWLGHRPAPTDSLPFIGKVPAMRGAFTGFGHHHIGLTAGPRTGRILAGLISGETPNINLAPYAPDRFQ
ncbi:FAD-dependent oxidoreductase [Defluviimonas sp. WL0002]|uniref:FAD-dependent oxidoreductase n=1 Tax=Albidovulum marisflavi TaxID=2984159 RepID=A0ABT2ZGH7_9RHOB|nr:FAD-dependent oxidoreductase [Defluviimonas sp. WL0002]MCV2870214.1 FAD-dependent oxidoreductase [Defluviimonas sp. WL0002]